MHISLKEVKKSHKKSRYLNYLMVWQTIVVSRSLNRAIYERIELKSGRKIPTKGKRYVIRYDRDQPQKNTDNKTSKLGSYGCNENASGISKQE